MNRRTLKFHDAELEDEFIFKAIETASYKNFLIIIFSFVLGLYNDYYFWTKDPIMLLSVARYAIIFFMAVSYYLVYKYKSDELNSYFELQRSNLKITRETLTKTSINLINIPNMEDLEN